MPLELDSVAFYSRTRDDAAHEAAWRNVAARLALLGWSCWRSDERDAPLPHRRFFVADPSGRLAIFGSMPAVIDVADRLEAATIPANN